LPDAGGGACVVGALVAVGSGVGVSVGGIGVAVAVGVLVEVSVGVAVLVAVGVGVAESPPTMPHAAPLSGSAMKTTRVARR
jgi:hypothetical protein